MQSDAVMRKLAAEERDRNTLAWRADRSSPDDRRQREIGFLLMNKNLGMTDRRELIEESGRIDFARFASEHPIQALFVPQNAIPGIGGTSAAEDALMLVLSGANVAKGYAGRKARALSTCEET